MIRPTPFLEATPHGWQLKLNEAVVAQSFDVNGDTTALLQEENFLPLPLRESIAIENGLTLKYGDSRFEMAETVKMLPSGLLEIERSWTNLQAWPQDAALLFEVHTQFNPTFTLIPGVSYNGNHWGTGSEPKGLSCDGQPWVFSYKRTGIPSATFSESSQLAVGVWVDDKEPASLCSACSMQETDVGLNHRVFWPEREEPKSYIDRDRYALAHRNTLRLAPRVPFKVKCYVWVGEVAQERTGWTQAFDCVQDLFDHRLAPHLAPEQVWELAMNYVQNVLFQRRDEFCAFHIGLLPQTTDATGDATGAAWKLREGGQYEIGWCGQNATFAHALLHDYQTRQNPESLQQAVQVLDTWVHRARFDNGLFATLLDVVLAGHNEIISDTCNLGWGAWQTLRAYEKAQQIGLDKPEWLNFGMGLCDFFVDHSDEQGRFGKLWTQAGACVDWEGTVGCFILLPLLHAYRMTHKPEYLERALRGFNFYVTHDLNNIECTAGALDTHCIDKETCWPLLASALDLHELTGEESYLDTAILAGHYTLSWMFHFDALYEERSDFSRHGYRTLGATSVSTQHHHLDPWGALLCRDWLRLYRHSGDERWLTRARATWANSLLCVSVGRAEQ